jgi:hypothetical protein
LVRTQLVRTQLVRTQLVRTQLVRTLLEDQVYRWVPPGCSHDSSVLRAPLSCESESNGTIGRCACLGGRGSELLCTDHGLGWRLFRRSRRARETRAIVWSSYIGAQARIESPVVLGALATGKPICTSHARAVAIERRLAMSPHRLAPDRIVATSLAVLSS